LSFHQNKSSCFKEEKYDLSDPVYQQWLKIYCSTVEQTQEKQVQDEPIAYSAQEQLDS